MATESNEQRTSPNPSRRGIWSIGLVRARTLSQLQCSLPTQPIISEANLQPFGSHAAADPFAIRHSDGVWYLFFEMFRKGSDIAVIGGASSRDLLSWDVLGPVLETPHHLSYPFVFRHGDDIYMMPESKSVRQVNLYRAVDFPRVWKFEKTILRGRLMDASMIEHEGRFWIFAAWRSYWMRLFYADHPLGPWRSHWLPTVRSYSKRNTRPGGRPIMLDGKLMRFAQDNQKHYGHQLRAMHVTSLDRWWFNEREWGTGPLLTPTGQGWNANSMHHIDAHVMPDGEIIGFVDGAT